MDTLLLLIVVFSLSALALCALAIVREVQSRRTNFDDERAE
jgi:hypothetical protein